jgi:hypothetical protein
MQFIHRFRVPALFCAVAVLACELVSHPYTTMGVCDDLPYIVSAQTLAATGHIVYNGGATAILGWQLYLGALFAKLFGSSLSAVRASTLLTAMAMAFVLQRTLVRAGINERNATIGTLALVLSPLYLMLSFTFMSDIHGLFAIVLCLYGCLRALHAPTSRSASVWLCLAVLANALCGTSRQIAWLGVLVMVPSTLWLLRAHRNVVLRGGAFAVAGAAFIYGCMRWFKQQPYALPPMPQGVSITTFPVLHLITQLVASFLDIPFLLLPIIVVFLPEIRKSRLRVIAAISMLLLGYLVLALHPNHLRHISLLEPTQGDWVDVHGIYEGMVTQGEPPIFLHKSVQILLTVISIGSLLALIVTLFRDHERVAKESTRATISWRQLGVLLIPFTLAYFILLSPLAALGIYDRYLLGPLVVLLICLVRYYQDRIQSRLPLVSVIVVGLMAIYGIAVTHNMFALYRARVVLANELVDAGVPDTAVDNGWEYNWGVQLRQAGYINDARITLPLHVIVNVPRSPGKCQMWWHERTPQVQPVYAVSFNRAACYGPAPFAPVTYSQWFESQPGTLYVVRFSKAQ